MIILLSPSKSILFKPVADSISGTQPQFLAQSKQLSAAVMKVGPKLSTLFGVSAAIATENQKQFSAWTHSPAASDACPAAWAYRGETFAGLSIEKFDQKSILFAQRHLYIISGLYGLLRPLDLIMPYRLEMTTQLSGSWGKNLYSFWGTTLTKHIEAQKPDWILNCASDAYFQAIGRSLSTSTSVITPIFLHQGKKKMAFSKYSRGLMARWVIEKKITNSQDIVKFDAEGYVYDPKKSTQNEPVFNAPKDFSIAGRWKKT